MVPLQITFLAVTLSAEERGEEEGLVIPDGTTTPPPRLAHSSLRAAEVVLNPVVVSGFSAKKETLI